MKHKIKKIMDYAKNCIKILIHKIQSIKISIRMKKLIFAASIIFGLGIASFSAIQLIVLGTAGKYIVEDVSKMPECDAVMVLGTWVNNKRERPGTLLKARLDYGYELYAAGKAPKILVSGDHGRLNYDEVNIMKQYLMDLGVPPEDIFMDHAGFNTYDSMYRARDIFQVESMLICTQEYHISRSIYIARSMGIDSYGYPCNDYRSRMNWALVREVFARAKAVFDTTIQRKPKYLGEAIPISGDGRLTDDKPLSHANTPIHLKRFTQSSNNPLR